MHVMMRTLAFGAVGLVAGASSTANAQVAVYSDPAAFGATNPGLVSYGFPVTSVATTVVGPTFSTNGVTFSTTGPLYVVNASSYPNSVLLDFSASPLNIDYAGAAIGLDIGSIAVAQTVKYSVNGMSGSVSVPTGSATTFVGFSTGGAPVSLTLSGIDLTIVGFRAASAVPEGASWAMMMAGLGVIGGSLRRRRSVTMRARLA